MIYMLTCIFLMLFYNSNGDYTPFQTVRGYFTTGLKFVLQRNPKVQGTTGRLADDAHGDSSVIMLTSGVQAVGSESSQLH